MVLDSRQAPRLSCIFFRLKIRQALSGLYSINRMGTAVRAVYSPVTPTSSEFWEFL